MLGLDEAIDPCVVLDAHSDLFNDVVDRRARGDRRVVATRHLPELRKGGVDALVCAIYVEARHKPDRALHRALRILDAIHEELAESPNELALCVNRADLEAASERGKLGILIGLEGAEPLGEDLAVLRLLHRVGLRLVGLTWNQRNQVADGIGERRTRGRLTEYGVRLVRELARMGVLIDLAHVAETAFFDALEIADGPVVVSHANCAAVCPHERNLTDEQLKGLAAGGGVLGITFHPPLVSATDPSVEGVLQHLEHAAGVMGADRVGIGADFSDFIVWDPAEVGEGFEDRPKTRGLESVAGLPGLAEGLKGRGFSSEEVCGVLGGNFLRVIGEVLG